MPITAISSNVNLTSIDVDTLTESYFAGAAQDMTEQKKQVGSRLNASLRDMNGKRDKQIKELNKYVKELTKGGFFKSFLKVFNFVLKILSPLQTAMDFLLGKVFKGKLKILGMILSAATQIAMSVATGGASLIQFAVKAIFKNVTDLVLKIVQVAVSLAQGLSQFGINTLELIKQKNMALHQKEAEKFQTLAMQADKTVEKTSDEIRRIQEDMNQLIARASETINIEESGRESLAGF